MGKEEPSPPAPGADMPGTPDPRGATRLEPPAGTPEAFPFPSTRCVRFGVQDVVRSAAAAESVAILAQMQAEEATSPL